MQFVCVEGVLRGVGWVRIGVEGACVPSDMTGGGGVEGAVPAATDTRGTVETAAQTGCAR